MLNTYINQINFLPPFSLLKFIENISTKQYNFYLPQFFHLYLPHIRNTNQMEWRKHVIYFICLLSIGLDHLLLSIFGIICLLVTLLHQLISSWLQKKFEENLLSFSKLKLMEKQLFFLQSVHRYKALVGKLSGKDLSKSYKNPQNQLCKGDALFDIFSSILNELELINKNCRIKIFQYKYDKVCDKNVKIYLAEIPQYFEKTLIQLKLNWMNVSENIYFRWKIVKKLQKHVEILKFCEKILHQQAQKHRLQQHSNYFNHFSQELDSLKTKFCSDHQFSVEELKIYVQLTKNIQDYLSDKKKIQIDCKPQIQVFHINENANNGETILTQKMQKIQVQYEKSSRQEFKKKLDSLLIMGMHERKQRLQEQQQKAQMEKQLLRSGVKHSSEQGKYQIMQIDDCNESSEKNKRK